jgi:hypothetical protein
MTPLIKTNDPGAVQAAVRSVYRELYADADPGFIPRVFGWVVECFSGSYRDFQAVDVLYHDLEHTLQGTWCMAQLLRGRFRAGAEPVLPRRVFELGMAAILMHDTGYLKHAGDTEGTGAKYTLTHVERSAAFAEDLLREKGFSPRDTEAVKNMIHCTGLETELDTLPFQSEAERITGYALGSADLLGQMAAEDYVDKLPVLYEEFAEAARSIEDPDHFLKSYHAPEDLIRRTPAFWRQVVLPKLDQDFLGLYRFLSEPYPHGPNPYVRRVEENIARIASVLSPT